MPEQRGGDLPAPSSARLVAHGHRAFAVQNRAGASPFLVLGDHAGRSIPRVLARLGLPRADLARHIAWDIGVAALGAALSRALDATFIAQRYSRLVIDCNRALGDPTSIPAHSDGSAVPGNARLSPAERAARADSVFHPYHRRIAAELDARAAAGRRTILLSLHSFTPALAGGPARPWRYGVLHRGDSALSTALLGALAARCEPGTVGDNQPYAMDGADFTIPFHADARGLDYLEIEVAQALIATDAGVREAAAVLGEALTAVAGQG